MPAPPPLIRASAALLRAAVLVDEQRGLLRVDEAEWAAMAAQELLDGLLPTPAPPALAGTFDARDSAAQASDDRACADLLRQLATLAAERASECMIEGGLRPDQLRVDALGPHTPRVVARLAYALLAQDLLPAYHHLHPLSVALCRLPAPDPDHRAVLTHAADILGLDLDLSADPGPASPDLPAPDLAPLLALLSPTPR